MIALVSVLAEPPWAWFSLRPTVDLGVGTLTYRDVGLIETNHATRDGRTTINYVPTHRRATPHMQERDPRRDVLGCNRNNQKNVANEPEKEP